MLLLIDIGITNNPSFNKRYINRGLLSIASYLEKKGIDVIFYPMDYYISNHKDVKKVFEHIKSIIDQFNVDIVAISNMFDSEYSLFESTINFVKTISKDIKVIIGGLSPSFHVNHIKDKLNFDVLVKTEGEFILYDLITKIRKKQNIDDVQGIVFKKGEKTYSNKIISLGNLAELSAINYNLVPRGYILNETPPIINIELQRGCFNKCSFCSIPSFMGEKVRLHDLNKIIKEFEILYDIGYSGTLVLEDSTINFKSKRIKLFLNKILKIKKSFSFEYITTHYQYLDKESLNLIKSIGFKEIFLGLESASKRVQNITNKQIDLDNFIQVAQVIKEHRLNVNVFIIIGLPGETEDTFKETYNFVKKNITENIISNVFPVHFIPYPNTKAHNDFFKFGGISINKDSTNWTFQGEAIVNYKHISKEELDTMYNKMNDLNKLSKSTYYLYLKK